MSRTLRTNNGVCPKCHKSQQGEPIPKESQAAYGATHFSVSIAHYSRERDITVQMLCGHCNHILWDVDDE